MKKYILNFKREKSGRFNTKVFGSISFYFDSQTNQFFKPEMRIFKGSIIGTPTSENVSTSVDMEECTRIIDGENVFIKEYKLNGLIITRELNTIFSQNISKGLVLNSEIHNFNISVVFLQSIFGVKRQKEERKVISVIKPKENYLDIVVDEVINDITLMPRSIVEIIQNKVRHVTFSPIKSEEADKIADKYSSGILVDIIYRYVCLGQSFRDIEVAIGFEKEKRTKGGGFKSKNIIEKYWGKNGYDKASLLGYSKQWFLKNVRLSKQSNENDKIRLISNSADNNLYNYISNTFTSEDLFATTGYISLDLLSDFILKSMNDEQRLILGIGDYSALYECANIYSNIFEFKPKNIGKDGHETPRYKIIKDFSNASKKINTEKFSFFTNKESLIHAKSYLYNEQLVIGSSNFTHKGSTKGNLELSLSTTDKKAITEYKEWYNDIRKNAVDIKPEVMNMLSAKGNMSEPWVIKNKIIEKLISKEDEVQKPGLAQFKNSKFYEKLYDHQKDAFHRAIEGLDKHNIFMIADAVGLGKTPIALSIMRYYSEVFNGRTMVFAPKSVAEGVWEPFKTNEDNVFKETWQFELVSISEFSKKETKYTENWIGTNKLLIIDESHYFRNSGSERIKNFKRLIDKAVAEGSKVLLLTATPIFNNFNDIVNQLFLGRTPDNATYIREFFSKLNKSPDFVNSIESDDSIHAFLKERMISRSKRFVRSSYKNNLEMPSKINPQDIKVSDNSIDYHKIFDLIDQSIDGRAQGIIKFMLAKRLEESTHSFIDSIKRLLENKSIISRQEQLNFNSKKDIKDLTDGYFVKNEVLKQILVLCQGEMNIEPKYEALKDTLKTKEIKDGIAIFTTSINTSEMLYRKLQEDFSDYTIGCISGVSAKVSKEYLNKHVKDHKDVAYLFSPNTMSAKISERMKKDPRINGLIEKPKIDILILTDKFAEGINLQQNKTLVNFNHPWTPMINQQRIGRIYRVGSKHKEIDVINMFPASIVDEKVNLYKRLLNKDEIANTLIDLPNIFEKERENKTLSLSSASTKEVPEKLMDMFVHRNEFEILQSKDKKFKPGWFTLINGEEYNLYNLFECEGDYILTMGMEKVSCESKKNLRKLFAEITIEENWVDANAHMNMKRFNSYDEIYSEYLVKHIQKIPKEYHDKTVKLIATVFVSEKGI